jgi:hypothetical protein
MSTVLRFHLHFLVLKVELWHLLLELFMLFGQPMPWFLHQLFPSQIDVSSPLTILSSSSFHQ